MTIPARPIAQDQGKTCSIGGVLLNWVSCTCYGYAMGIDKATLGRKRPTGCAVRYETGDRSGGTSIPQNEGVARREYGVTSEVRVGSNVCTPIYAAGRLRQGRGFGLQGNSVVCIGTPFRSTGTGVNHYIYVNEGRGWQQTAGGMWYPKEVLVYDPAANGRTVGWGTSDDAPSWWPWSLLLKFAAALKPWGEWDSRTLGPGKFYCNIFPDTEPHVHLRFTGSKRTVPFPRPMTVRSPVTGQRVNVRSGPSTSYGVVTRLATGARFGAYQVNTAGQLLAGSRTWYGDHNGKRWVHSSGVR